MESFCSRQTLKVTMRNGEILWEFGERRQHRGFVAGEKHFWGDHIIWKGG